MTLDYVVVGAGLTGLSFTYDLKNKNSDAKIQILEKSRGCGGRMATRRIDHLQFDHGAQFIRKTDLSAPWINIWKQAEVAQRFPGPTIDGVCGLGGITSLAKVLAKNLEIKYEVKVHTIKFEEGSWTVRSQDDTEIKAKNLILTCPLPQSLELLQNSGVSFDQDLKKINYSKALVVLVESDLSLLQLDPNYEEDINEEIFSICSQQAKNNLRMPAWTVVMTPGFSESHFDLSDEQILEKATHAIEKCRPNILIDKVHLKKWRYSAPLQCWPKLFENPAAGLYLAGDAFGGPSLLGALRSSRALLDHVLPD